MALDLCIEGAGWLLMMVDTNAPDMARFLPRRSAATPAPIPAATPKTAVAASPDDRRQRVRTAAAELPLDQARAVWLVDVCGYRYAQAADALAIDSSEVAARLAAGRQTIRSSIAEPAALRPRGR